MGHSPGPWRVEAPIRPDDGYSIWSQGPEFPIDVITCGLEAGVLLLEDANLIAAAPDLLSALKDAAHSLERQLIERGHPRDQADDCSLCRDVARAKAAINKAEGKAAPNG